MAREKAPDRPRKMIHIRLSEGVHKKLKVLAAKQGMSIQELVSKFIEKIIRKQG